MQKPKDCRENRITFLSLLLPGLVESSTDDYRAVLLFDETTQTTNQLPGLQETGQGFSEVSYDPSSLWTNGGDSFCQDDDLPGPSSHCAPLSYVPRTLIGVDAGNCGRGLSGKNSGGASVSFPGPVFDQSEESGPLQAACQIQEPQQPLDSSQVVLKKSFKSGRSQKRVCKKRPSVCRFCDKAFSSPANLESHVRTHTGEKPFGCTVCGKRFSQFWNLKIHKYIHTGERPYQCPLCPERFSDPSNLKKHQKRHHPPT